MRRAIILLICFLFLCACARSDGDYDRGYAAGYEAGYTAALSEAKNTSTPAVKSTNTPSDDESMTVYVSRNFIIHKKSTCSGMKYYSTMTLAQALSFGYTKCSKCWK